MDDNDLTEEEMKDLYMLIDELNQGSMRCDFCSRVGPEWKFTARRFKTSFGPIIGESDTGWAACAECRDFIMSRDRFGLVEVALAVDGLPEGMTANEKRQALLEAHALFFSHWDGVPPTRLMVQ